MRTSPSAYGSAFRRLARRTAAAVLACLLWAPAAAEKKSPTAADEATVALVRHFLDTSVSELPPKAVPGFLAVDPAGLPTSLQASYRAKREELLALKKIHDGSKKPALRRPAADAAAAKQCEEPEQGPKAVWVLRHAGYGEISESEERYLMDKTRCAECELEVEFTLRRVLDHPRGKKKPVEKPRVRYFLHTKDPLWNLVGLARAGRQNPFGTNFFGIGYPSCR